MNKKLKCPWCASEHLETWLDYQPIGLFFQKCAVCGVTSSKYGSQGLNYAEYDGDLFDLTKSSAADAERQEERIQLESRWLAERLEAICGEKLTKACSILDVGCGPGGLVNELGLRYESAIVEGVDPSRHNVRAARERYGFDITEAYWSEYVGETKDIISFFGNLMLHTSPKESLLKAYDLLNPGGILIFDVKNPYNPTRSALIKTKKLLPDVSPIRKLYWHSFHGMPWGLPRPQLQALCADIGFKFVKVRSFSGRTAVVNGKNRGMAKMSAFFDRILGDDAWWEFACFK